SSDQSQLVRFQSGLRARAPRNSLTCKQISFPIFREWPLTPILTSLTHGVLRRAVLRLSGFPTTAQAFRPYITPAARRNLWSLRFHLRPVGLDPALRPALYSMAAAILSSTPERQRVSFSSQRLARSPARALRLG